jgi:hypothetical protein
LNKPQLVDVAETVYHEARHCEQWFHMARFYALGRTQVDISQNLGIPVNIANAAFARKMTQSDKMNALTADWFKSVYGESSREVTLTALAMKRVNNTIDLGNFHARVHQAYSGGLAEEDDAWAIQLLVRAKL